MINNILNTIKQLIIKEKYFFIIALAMYFLFFFSLWIPGNFFWGSDIEIFHFPSRTYIHEVIMNEHRFPLWTEKILLGYPIYADMENAYLNPVNIISIVLFGPILSFKILHLLQYLLASFCLKKLMGKHDIGVKGWFVANLTFFFSFFFLNHGIHLDIIMTAMLLPIFLLLTEEYFGEFKSKYLVMQGVLLAYAIYWGHPHVLVLLLLGVVIYYLTVLANKKNLGIALMYFLIFIGIGISLALPQLIPSAKTFMQSSREELGIEPQQGSISPKLLATTIFPFLYGRWDYYYGKDVLPRIEYGNASSSQLTYTETYVYLGLAATILAFVALIFTNKKTRLFNFGYATLWLFIILATIRYLPFLANTPPFSMFRYWMRSIFLLALGFGIIAGYLVENLDEIKTPKLKNWGLISAPIAYLIIIELLNSKDSVLLKINRSFETLQTKLYTTKDILLWFSILVGIPLILFLKKYINKRIVEYLICFIVLLDLGFFSRDVLRARIGIPFKPDFPKTQQFINKRIVLDTMGATHADAEGNTLLLLPSWSPYGYTQFMPKSYTDYFVQSKIGLVTKATNAKIIKPEDYKRLRKDGFSGVFTDKETIDIAKSTENKIDLIRNEDIEGKYLKKQEGHIVWQLSTLENLNLETNIKYDTNWVVKINGKISKPTPARGIFFDIELPKGTNIVDIKYVPKDIYLGVGLGTLLAGFLVLIAYKLRPSIPTNTNKKAPIY